MILYPAIDIKDGKCVRLCQGEFDNVKIYNEDPVEVAKQFEAAGASFLHVVDLDGAKAGNDEHLKLIARMTAAVKIPVQTGGGVRTLDDVESRLNAGGVARVIVGTTAAKNPELVGEWIGKHSGKRIVAGIDAKNGMVATEGWLKVSSKTALELALELEGYDLETVVYTDISKDGMLEGPNFEATKELIDNTKLKVIASGGVSCMQDIARLKEIGAAGVILGKSLYENKIDLAEAIKEFDDGWC